MPFDVTDQTLPVGATRLDLDLLPFGSIDSVTGTLVKMVLNSGGKRNPLFIELFDRLDAVNPAAVRTTPLTAANFLGYVDSGAYNGVVFHRLVPDFVLQGGGFKSPASPQKTIGYYPLESTPQGPTVLNEPGNANVLGTLAMAKRGGDANSATNQFFFNLADNRTNLDAQNGGFTVFGRLVGAKSFQLLQGISALPRPFNDGDPSTDEFYESIPFLKYKPAKVGRPFNPIRPGNYLTISAAARNAPFTYKVKAKGARARVDANGQLQLSWTKRPTKPVTVTVQATSVLDPRERYRDTFVVTPAEAAPAVVAQAGFAPAPALFDSDPFGRDPLLAGLAVTDPLA